AVRWKLSRASAGFCSGPEVLLRQAAHPRHHTPMIREYRQQRPQHISKNMKQPVTGRTVNYEMHLLRGMMIFADCWTDSLAARYTPLRHIKKRAGKVAEKVQLMDIIKKAKENDYW